MDFTLLELKEDLSYLFNAPFTFVQPICLPNMHNMRAASWVGKSCFIAGFGKTQQTPVVKYSDRLMEASTFGRISF